MGSCGCGDFSGVRWAVTVGGRVLAVSEYDGCNNGCAAPLGFTVHLMTKRGAKELGIEPTGEWKPEEHYGAGQFLNFFSQDELAAAAREIEGKDPINLSDYDSLGDLLDEIGLDLIRKAWELTQKREAELRERFGEKPPWAKAGDARKQEG